MEQLEFLEQELKMMLENIQRLKEFKKERPWQYQSRVVGEFKHRAVALKQRLTLAGRITTSELTTK